MKRNIDEIDEGMDNERDKMPKLVKYNVYTQRVNGKMFKMITMEEYGDIDNRFQLELFI